MLVFDCETNGLLHELDRVHCLGVKDTVTGAYFRYVGDEQVQFALRMLQEATEQGIFIVGHNVIKFDVPAIQKVYPWWKPVKYYVLDTMVLGRLLYPDKREMDTRLKAKGQLPGKLYKKDTLAAWGHRLGIHKGDYEGPWHTYTPEMGDYMDQDVVVTDALLTRFQKSKLWPEQTAIDLEMAVQWVLARQERYGILFDQVAAAELYKKLAKRRIELEDVLLAVFKPFYVAGAVKTPTASRRVQEEELGEDPNAPIYKGRGKDRHIVGYKYRTVDYTEGAAYQVVTLTTFKPSSRDHVANRLKKLYGWKPTEFTDDGKPKIDDDILAALPYPEAKPLAEFYLVLKRLGSLAEGKEAWMKHVKEDGRIHGGVNTNGTVTGRMSHMYPNMAQVPSTRSPYGHECRALFIAPPGKVYVGADADALELRCLGHFMARFDNGEYVGYIVLGKKSDGTDSHSVNARAIGLDPKALIHELESGRDVAKTWFYAFIYGAGNEKLGYILIRVKGRKAMARGKQSRDALMHNLPALEKLIEAVKKSARARDGWLKGIDGRWLRVRSEHSAPNTVLQSAGGVLMKRALVILDNNLQEKGYVPGEHYEFVANVHDEWQIECDEAIGRSVGALAVDAIRLAGESFGFRCPLGGEYRIGRNWAETH